MDHVCRWPAAEIRNGRKTPQTRTSTTCSSCWSSATRAWARPASCSAMRTIRSRRHSFRRWVSTSKWRLCSGTRNALSYRYGWGRRHSRIAFQSQFRWPYVVWIVGHCGSGTLSNNYNCLLSWSNGLHSDVRHHQRGELQFRAGLVCGTVVNRELNNPLPLLFPFRYQSQGDTN